MRYGKKWKLSSRYTGLHEILDKVRSVAYKLALHPELAKNHNIFHISMLKKHHSNLPYILSV
jgi:hypothetical protein